MSAVLRVSCHHFPHEPAARDNLEFATSNLGEGTANQLVRHTLPAGRGQHLRMIHDERISIPPVLRYREARTCLRSNCCFSAYPARYQRPSMTLRSANSSGHSLFPWVSPVAGSNFPAAQNRRRRKSIRIADTGASPSRAKGKSIPRGPQLRRHVPAN
jgi:hypothetical protein